MFDIQLEETAVAAAIDRRFRSRSLQGRTVNAKLYLKREGLLDMTDSPALDRYLVLAGPAGRAGIVAWGSPTLLHRFQYFSSTPASC